MIGMTMVTLTWGQQRSEAEPSAPKIGVAGAWRQVRGVVIFEGLASPEGRLPAVPQSVSLPGSTGAYSPSFQIYQTKVS
jgi:hypothetical protein